MKYSKEQYKEFVNKYCIETNCPDNIKRALHKEIMLTSDILNDELDLPVIIQGVILSLCNKSKTYQAINWNRQVIINFVFWAERKSLIIGNPFYDARLSLPVLVNIVKQSLKNKWYSSKDIEDIVLSVNELPLGSTVYEVLVRLFYEGVPSISDIMSIKDSDIHNGYIETSKFRINISNKLETAIKKYQKIETLDGNRPHYFYQCDDLLIRLTTFLREPEINIAKIRNNISGNYFKRAISEQVGYRVVPTDLYVSGVLNYFREVTNYDEEIFYNTFLGVKNMRPDIKLMKQLSDIQFEYNRVREPGYKIRERLSMYIKEES